MQGIFGNVSEHTMTVSAQAILAYVKLASWKHKD